MGVHRRRAPRLLFQGGCGGLLGGLVPQPPQQELVLELEGRWNSDFRPESLRAGHLTFLFRKKARQPAGPSEPNSERLLLLLARLVGGLRGALILLLRGRRGGGLRIVVGNWSIGHSNSFRKPVNFLLARKYIWILFFKIQ